MLTLKFEAKTESLRLRKHERETASPAEAWIRPRTQSLLTWKSSSKIEQLPTQKQSTTMLSQMMFGFVSAHSPT
jgi:hypothetical protein